MIKTDGVKCKKYNFTDERSIINGANNLAEVIKIVEKHPKIQWGEVLSDIKYYTRIMDKSNSKGHESIIYETKGYSDNSLEYNDKKNKGEVLLFTSPTCSRSTAGITIANLTIATIKADLKYVLPNGTNYVFAHYRGFGIESINNLLKNIELYEEQVERQAQLTDSRKCNIFKLNYNDKKKIANTYYREIIETLLRKDNKGLIWGELTDNQRRLYLESLMSDTSRARTIRNNLVNDIANYTTINELESFKNGDEKVLSRFIR